MRIAVVAQTLTFANETSSGSVATPEWLLLTPARRTDLRPATALGRSTAADARLFRDGLWASERSRRGVTVRTVLPHCLAAHDNFPARLRWGRLRTRTRLTR